MRRRLTYALSGVDQEAADEAKRLISRALTKTFNERVVTEAGLFAGGFEVGDRVILASVDGVGTKVIVAAMMGVFDTIGADLVNHCANDIAVHNADPAFFLDYIAHADLPPSRIAELVSGVARACRDVGAALIAGETAQMPGIYAPGRFDLVGFIAGEVKRSEIVKGDAIRPGDVVVALPSNGLHTNGYSLARKALFDVGGLDVESYVDELGETVGEALLKTHRLYLPAVRLLRGKVELHGMAHITGGGVEGNLVRILPQGCQAVISKQSAPKPPVFSLIQRLGNVEEAEMFRTFNMGFGFLFVLPPEDAQKALDILGDEAFVAGEIKPGERKVLLV